MAIKKGGKFIDAGIQPKTKQAEFYEFVNGLSEFLAPRFGETLIKLSADAMREISEQEENKRITARLQELEPLLKEYERSVNDYPAWHKFKLRPIIKKIVELYGKTSTSKD